ncbi:hypothetical protein HL658_16335 [Azospirillum sp. RWY-5-1]|uniref:Uncharacterized protein n=1 Tax=Azospirillum oleiclasticum TaxID=2735135 RepID=A0ABX2TEM1_9PROT|nr:hypothetical protein [Azospirillum oleiclasticum]NYZ14124.1 hypothetical protein [Azospirillum oleiclasticum]NYZ21608.1 hypothetical protein [Azospirillum oleiclasticum]
MNAQSRPASEEPVLSPAKEREYRDRIAGKLRARGTPEAEIPGRVEELLHRRLPIDFRAAGLFG